jgi:hypothetical protein
MNCVFVHGIRGTCNIKGECISDLFNIGCDPCPYLPTHTFCQLIGIGPQELGECNAEKQCVHAGKTFL